MERMKIFSATNDPQWVEDRLNKWLTENDITIVRVLQSQSGRIDTTITITIFYVENEN